MRRNLCSSVLGDPSALSRPQGTEYACSQASVYLQEEQRPVVLCLNLFLPPLQRGAHHNSSLTSSSLLFFSSASFPEETLTTGHFFQAPPTRSQTSPRASSLASTFPPNGKTAAGERRKKGRRCETHELMETGTPSAASSLLHISGPRLNFHSSCSETIFPLLQFPGNPGRPG